MLTARQLLQQKPDTSIISVAPSATVFEALQVLAVKNVGAVLVMENGVLEGVFSERDYARRLVLEGKASVTTQVCDIMTTKVCYVPPTQTVSECMALMTEKRIRHLPVMEGTTVLGVVSIGDVVRATIDEQALPIGQLTHYISH